MASLDQLPAAAAADTTSTIGGSVGRTLRAADLYGLHQEEILRQQAVTLGAGWLPHADYGLKTPPNLAGLPADLAQKLAPKLPRGVGRI